ncbi:hypothetical protein GGR52DRAFT_298430 [Hypoxylon sp. FL1284]|nr:hypothetical protein GGR52DRAFT_298430 [Hypoxylon sp. FL1284]
MDRRSITRVPGRTLHVGLHCIEGVWRSWVLYPCSTTHTISHFTRRTRMSFFMLTPCRQGEIQDQNTAWMEYSDSDQVIEVLDGAVRTRVIRHPKRSFAFEVTLDLVKGAGFFAQKPPLHFHANQDEYVQAVEGTLALEIDGRELLLTRGGPEVRIAAWASHRTYPVLHEDDDDGAAQPRVVRFLLSGAETPEAFRLTTPFFENWYRYQDEVLRTGGRIDMIQVLSTFDAGGTYVSPPPWLPFGKRISQVAGVVVGRWLGGLLGYQPFYREWSSDWDLAAAQMETSLFQRRFADRRKTD